MDEAEIREVIAELRELSHSDDLDFRQAARDLLRRAADQLEADLSD